METIKELWQKFLTLNRVKQVLMVAALALALYRAANISPFHPDACVPGNHAVLAWILTYSYEIVIATLYLAVAGAGIAVIAVASMPRWDRSSSKAYAGYDTDDDRKSLSAFPANETIKIVMDKERSRKRANLFRMKKLFDITHNITDPGAVILVGVILCMVGVGVLTTVQSQIFCVSGFKPFITSVLLSSIAVVGSVALAWSPVGKLHDASRKKYNAVVSDIDTNFQVHSRTWRFDIDYSNETISDFFQYLKSQGLYAQSLSGYHNSVLTIKRNVGDAAAQTISLITEKFQVDSKTYTVLVQASSSAPTAAVTYCVHIQLPNKCMLDQYKQALSAAVTKCLMHVHNNAPYAALSPEELAEAAQRANMQGSNNENSDNAVTVEDEIVLSYEEGQQKLLDIINSYPDLVKILNTRVTVDATTHAAFAAVGSDPSYFENIDMFDILSLAHDNMHDGGYVVEDGKYVLQKTDEDSEDA